MAVWEASTKPLAANNGDDRVHQRLETGGTVVNLGVWLITLQAIGMPHVIPGLMKAVGIVYSEGD
ncbi:hypothetical protein OsI_22621 [Oryza sativa Indica Group]|uniref:Uncharacterized protein n=4 Tax=Oryza TaxID=4527 RepID=A3BAW8_ORYSJ|nr:hypothetical protein OsI_22621 [Oryza sativa Indica Group]EAZ36707.1 hypothetical protein OsJ_21043 [Oryza sativa Japonica Group]